MWSVELLKMSELALFFNKSIDPVMETHRLEPISGPTYRTAYSQIELISGSGKLKFCRYLTIFFDI